MDFLPGLLVLQLATLPFPETWDGAPLAETPFEGVPPSDQDDLEVEILDGAPLTSLMALILLFQNVEYF